MGRSKRNEDSGESTQQARRPSRGIHLLNGEEVVVEARPARIATPMKYVYTFGLYGIWRKRNLSVVTNRRILLTKGIFNREERSIPISHVESVRYSRRGFRSYARVAVNDRGQHRIETVGPLSSRGARRFIAEVFDRI